MKKKPTLESRIMHLESLLTAHASAVKRLNQEKADAIREGQAHIDRLQKELEEQKQRCADLQKESFDSWNEVACARAESDKLKVDLQTARDCCARLSKQLDVTKSELIDIRSEMEQSVKPWWKEWTASAFAAGFFVATTAWTVLAALILPADKTSKSIDQMRTEIHSLSNAIAMTRVVTNTVTYGTATNDNDVVWRELKDMGKAIIPDPRWQIVSNLMGIVPTPYLPFANTAEVKPWMLELEQRLRNGTNNLNAK